MGYLYVFIDVSGNYDFSRRGTKHLVLTSLMCADVGPGILELYALRHKVIDEGIDIEEFKASEDKQAVRNRVFDIISAMNHIRVNSVVVDKTRTDPSLQPLKRLYPAMIENLLSYPFDAGGIDVSRFDKVFIFADYESSRASERESLKKGVKLSLARHLARVPYVICMHDSRAHPYLQVVDYCCWAIYVKWERGERRPFEAIERFVDSETLISESGQRHGIERNNPPD